MTTFEKMIKMYEIVHGEIDYQKYEVKPLYPIDDLLWCQLGHKDPVGIEFHWAVSLSRINDTVIPMRVTKEDLMFDYLTLGW